MVLQTNRKLLNYWNKVRGERKAPKRTDITPAAISNLLPVTFILENRHQSHENQHQDNLRFRIAGSRIGEIFGREFRGLDFINCWPTTERPILQRHLGQLMREGAIITLTCLAKSANEHQGDFEFLLLPLTHSGTAIDRILGSISPVGDYPWLGLTALEFDQITEINVSYQRTTLTANLNPAKGVINQSPHKRLVKSKHCQFRVYDGGKAV